MQLTEPQAGSDVGALRTRAERAADGTYRITGQKIFITYGEHDLTDNIIHLVLARLPDAPPGTRGISLFLVPKFLLNADGTPGARNDVRAHSIEHKLGIHGSPTCTMVFGDNGGAIGYLIGEENAGMACMFTMMNRARLAVGLQGVGIAERATQQAIAYARERRQGRMPGMPAKESAPIIAHPDVKRMLMTMRALTQAARSICYATALAIDRAERGTDKAAREAAHARASLLTPLAKAFSSDIGIEVASLGVQVHGGMGFIEETGAAQLYRDARIAPIYEGTNGIQAIDLVTRKLPLDGGAAVETYLGELRGIVEAVNATNDPALGWIGVRLEEAVESLTRATRWMLANLDKRHRIEALAGATPYLRLFSITAGGCLLAQQALAALRMQYRSRLRASRWRASSPRTIAVQARALERTIVEGARRRDRRRSGAGRVEHRVHVHAAHHPSRLSRPSHAARSSRAARPAARHRARAGGREISDRSPASQAPQGRARHHRALSSDGLHRRLREATPARRHRASRRRHLDVAGHVRSGPARRRRRRACGRRGDGKEGRQCLCRHAAARPSCRNRAADGLLSVRQCRDRRALRAEAPRHRRARRSSISTCITATARRKSSGPTRR